MGTCGRPRADPCTRRLVLDVLDSVVGAKLDDSLVRHFVVKVIKLVRVQALCVCVCVCVRV